MDKTIFIILVILLSSCHQKDKPVQNNVSNSETEAIDTVAHKPQPNVQDPIIFIRKKVEHINTTSLQKKHIEFLCDEKTQVDYFYENGTIVKISIDFGTIGDIYAKEDYYFDEGKLIFFYEFVEGGPACEGCIKTNEYRSYIKDNKVFKYLKDKTVQKCRKCEFSISSKPYQLFKAKTPEQVKGILCG